LSETAAHKLRSLWKLIPGFAISGYFLWQVLKHLNLDHLKAMRLVSPVWIAVLVGFLIADYALRGYRWWYMLRSVRASYGACVRVILTSLAANNILPFRIGDFMRIFAYAPDVNAASSTVLSTVVLERLLDVFMLLAFVVVELWGVHSPLLQVPFHGHVLRLMPLAVGILVIAALGLGLLLFGTKLLHGITTWLVAKFGNHPRTKKLGEWSVLLFDAVLHLSFFGRVWLLVITALVWLCESMVFVSCARMVGLESGPRGPWLAGSLSNLSFLLPSAPGGIGPFEASAKLAMQTQGATDANAALYALLVHVIIFFAVTGVGGAAFLVHRAKRGPMSKPLGEDLEILPAEIDISETMPAELPNVH
jgi:uncharacterized membrane protein YbhN (UPF0104 family)